MSEPLVTVERDGPVAVVLLNRPEQLNALSTPLLEALVETLTAFDADESVSAVVLGGNERAFAAGADIAELESGVDRTSAADGPWQRLLRLRTPVVAAVSGYCLGGGCELAVACDLIVASETARFGQPEVNLGLIPGAGGTQRLVRAVGKSLAMDMILSGRMLTAREALAAGLVARVVAPEAWLDEAKRVARDIAAKGPVAVQLAKEAIVQSFDSTLTDGLAYERGAFERARSSDDAAEGLRAFLDKRAPEFKGR